MVDIRHAHTEEPESFTAALVALLALFTSFGANISSEQQGALIAFAAVVMGFYNRFRAAQLRSKAHESGRISAIQDIESLSSAS